MNLSTLRAEQISFLYPQDQRGLKPVSLEICEGQGLLIKGDSGCGKSTLARCLSGLIPHLYRGTYSGKVHLNGKPIQTMPLWEISEQIGIVFQNPAFQMLAPTVENEILFGLENLGLPKTEMKDRLEEAIDRFHLKEFRERSPHTLSGGEQQKLALAAITARQPQLLIFDEPLSMLDTTSAVEFVNFMDQLNTNGVSTIVCEHREKYLDHLKNFKKYLLNGKKTDNEKDELITQEFPYKVREFSLEIDNLSVTIGGRAIIKNLRLSVNSGQVVAFVGRNGAGKTTLFRALTGLQQKNGLSFVEQQGSQEAPQFNMIFQNPDIQLFNPTVREEILYRIKNPDLKLYAWLLSMLNLKRYENTPPLLLSEGEKRRVALAIALMHQTRHGILLDEPSLGQDERHKQILLSLMHSLARAGYLVMFSTHDLELAAGADQMILMKPEGIVRYGSSREVIRDDSAWEEIKLVRPEWMRFPCFD